MITTARDDIAAASRTLRDHGASRSDLARHEGAAGYLLSDYAVLGSVEGSAHCFGLFGACGVDGDDKNKQFVGILTPVAGAQTAQRAIMYTRLQGNAELDEMPTPLSAVEQAALFNAMASQPDADGVINLVISKGTTNHFLIGREETVTVRATAIKIKNG